VRSLRWYRLGLSCFLLIAIISLWVTRFDELIYHTLVPATLIDLGDAVAFDNVLNKKYLDRYVKITGILGNKAATLSGLRAGSFRMGRYQVRHLLGSKLYVEFDEAKYHKNFNPFTQITVTGRLVSFGPGSELQKVRNFFKEYYHQDIDDKAMLIVVDEKPRSEPVYIIFFIASLALVVASFWSTYKLFQKIRL
jgi:hypothetical protein